MKLLQIIITLLVISLFSQSKLVDYFNKYPVNWEDKIEVNIGITKTEFYQGEEIFIYLTIKNKTDEMLVVPEWLFKPILFNAENNKRYPPQFDPEAMDILVPGEKACIYFPGPRFFPGYLIEQRMYGFPPGKYYAFSKYFPNNKIFFNVLQINDKKVLDALKATRLNEICKIIYNNPKYKGDEKYQISSNNGIYRQIFDNMLEYNIRNYSIYKDFSNKKKKYEYSQEFENNVSIIIQKYSRYKRTYSLIEEIIRIYPDPQNILIPVIKNIETGFIKDFIEWKLNLLQNKENVQKSKKKALEEFNKIRTERGFPPEWF